MRLTIKKSDLLLSEFLLEGEHYPEMRCAGLGICKSCEVELISGTWEVNGKLVSAPAKALACQSKLLSGFGEIEFTESAKQGKISTKWVLASLPVSEETVIAVDIGTTTIAAVKIQAGKVIAEASCFNPQTKFGDNVLTRIHAARKNLKALQDCLLGALTQLFAELGLNSVSRIALAGNSTMTCLLHGIDPAPLGQMPFTLPMQFFPLRQDLFGAIPLYTVPCIAAHIGGDITAGLNECVLQKNEMLVDIGTNCEIVFNTESDFFCCSAAAGPALEGAGIKHGKVATKGAITHFQDLNNYSTVDNSEADGICASGIIDFLALAYDAGKISSFGRLKPKARFYEINEKVKIYESDIEKILQAKAAVFAGISTLENHLCQKAEKIYLAGTLAEAMNIKNAIKIKMLPERNYQAIGNSSLAGVARLAVDKNTMENMEIIVKNTNELMLNMLEDFADCFVDAMGI